MGTGSGSSRATDAAVAAISSPLLDFPIQEAQVRSHLVCVFLNCYYRV